MPPQPAAIQHRFLMDIGTMIPGKYSTRAVSTAPWADIKCILSSINWVPMLTNRNVDAAARQFNNITKQGIITHSHDDS